MPLSLPNLRLGITRPLGVNVGGTQAPVEQLDLYLNRSFWEIQNKFPLREKEVISTFSTIVGIRNYDVIFPTEAVKHIAIRKNNDGGIGQEYPLEQITRDQYEQLYATTEDQWDIPVKYVREGCIIRMWPTPDEAYTIIIKRLVALSDLSNVNSTTTIPQVWDEIIMFGALWRFCVDLGDLNRVTYFKSLQGEMINTIIPTEIQEIQSNSQLARVEVLGLDY